MFRSSNTTCDNDDNGVVLAAVARHRSAHGLRQVIGMVGMISALLLARSTHAQTFDPGCSDRTATGRFTCTLGRPIVSRPEWTYQSVQFAPGDRVYVAGDGCVQTGGSGATWKRYVNPSGGGSDHLYHGMVRIPSGRLAGTDVGNTLTRIKNVTERPIVVTGQGVNVEDLVLHLGYEDDDFSDNGYDRHDDGTEDQCKGANHNGPASVTVTICRGIAACGYPASRFDFDVVSNRMDTNGFLYNPHWSIQDRETSPVQTPPTSLCHEFAQGGSLLGASWPPVYRTPNLPDCTDQSGLDAVDSANDISANNIMCTAWARKGAGFAGHVNWFPVTVEGTAGPVTHEWGDDDYDFSFHTNDVDKGSLYSNGRPFLHAEFDSDETVDHFRSSAWKAFHDAVDEGRAATTELGRCAEPEVKCDASKLAALQAAMQKPADMFAGNAIATGLFGIDGEHDLKSELHPLYALATEPASTATQNDDTWLMFVRNRGDEGYCSSRIWAAGFDDYTFRIPWRDGMTDASVDWEKTEFEGSDGTTARPEVRIVAPIFVSTSSMARTTLSKVPWLLDPPGVYVTFHLSDPTTLPPGDSSASIPFVDGALHLAWTGNPNAGRNAAHSAIGGSRAVHARRAAPVREAAEADAENGVAIAASHLSDLGRKKVANARSLPNGIVVAHRLPTGTVEKVASPPSFLSNTSGPRNQAVAGPSGPAIAKLARDAAQMRALCEAADNAPYALPAETCKGVAVQPRCARPPCSLP